MNYRNLIIAAYEAGTITWEQIAEAFGDDPSDYEGGFEEFKEVMSGGMVVRMAASELGLTKAADAAAWNRAYDEFGRSRSDMQRARDAGIL